PLVVSLLPCTTLFRSKCGHGERLTRSYCSLPRLRGRDSCNVSTIKFRVGAPTLTVIVDRVRRPSPASGGGSNNDDPVQNSSRCRDRKRTRLNSSQRRT